MMRRVPAAPPAHNKQRPAAALPSSSGRNSKFLRAALAALVVAACSILYYRANYGRTLAASLEAALPDVLSAPISDLNIKSVIEGLGDVMYKYPFSLPPFYSTQIEPR